MLFRTLLKSSCPVLNGMVFTAFEKVFSSNATSYYNDEICSLALQNDGKIIAAGSSEIAGSGPAALARYLTNGQLDTSFSDDGVALAGMSGYATFRTVTVQTDGQVVAGGADARFYTSAFLQKFSSGGTAGPSIGFQFSAADNAAFSQTIVTSLISESDGSVLVGGFNDADAYIAHFSAALVQDSAFGNFPGGNVLLGQGNIVSLANSDDKIVVVTASRYSDTGQATYRLFR
ncbi:delta-60 repeat domain-containing protein [Deinococcus marmoris]